MADESGANQNGVSVDSLDRAPRQVRIESVTPVEPTDGARYAGSFRLRYLGDGSTIRRTSTDKDPEPGTVIHLSVTRSLQNGATAGGAEESSLELEGILFTLLLIMRFLLYMNKLSCL